MYILVCVCVCVCVLCSVLHCLARERRYYLRNRVGAASVPSGKSEGKYIHLCTSYISSIYIHATRVAASTPPPEHLDIFQGAPLRLPTPLTDQFPVRVCACPLCILNRLCCSTLSRTPASLPSWKQNGPPSGRSSQEPRYAFLYICMYTYIIYHIYTHVEGALCA